MSRRNWTKEDIEYIRDNYKNMSRKQLASKFDCSVSTISNKVNKYGLHKVKKWSEEEIILLKSKYGECTKQEIIELFPNRDYENVKLMASKLKISFGRDDFWTKQEDDIIISNWKLLEDFEMVELLPKRTHRAIKARRQELELFRDSGGIGVCCVSKNGDNCHSMGECILINYIIDLGFDYRKDVPYSEIIKDDKTNRTCDVCLYINNKVYAIELFGLYRKTPRNDMEMNYIHRMAYKYDSFIYAKRDDIIFIELYPDDVNHHNSKKMKKIINNILKENNYED